MVMTKKSIMVMMMVRMMMKDDDDGDDDETREGSSGDHGAANTHLSRLSAPCSQPSEGNEYSLDLSFCQKAFVDICHGHLLS